MVDRFERATYVPRYCNDATLVYKIFFVCIFIIDCGVKFFFAFNSFTLPAFSDLLEKG